MFCKRFASRKRLVFSLHFLCYLLLFSFGKLFFFFFFFKNKIFFFFFFFFLLLLEPDSVAA